MAYLLNEEERWTPSGLGCGPGCKCGPCSAKFAGFAQHYIPVEDEDEEEPEQAPPEESAPDELPQSTPESTAALESERNAARGRGSTTRRVPRARGTAHSGRRAPMLAGYPFGYWFPGLSGSSRFGAAGYPEPFGLYGGFGQAPTEQATLLTAIRRGERNLSKLTDMLFYARHRERRGAKLRREEAESIREWLTIRDQLVRPALTQAPIVPSVVQPGTPTSSSQSIGPFKQNLVRLALQEWNRWNKGALKEDDPRMRSVLEDYWKTGTGHPRSEQNWWSSVPWSAAFISWLMKKAGAGSAFNYSAGHSYYIKAAKDNRLTNNANPFKAYRINEIRPAVGDLVCKSRAGSGATYDNIQPGMTTHCDVVVGVEPGRLNTIGGNVRDSVSMTPVPTDAQGHVTSPNYFAVIKVPDLVSPPSRPPTSQHADWLRVVIPLLNRYRGEIPLDLLLGWIEVESGGKITSYTRLDERGYFQLHPGESQTLKLDHRRLSTDPDYSIQGGLALVRYYARLAEQLGFAPRTDLFWRMVKFLHALGSGAVRLMLADMRENGVAPESWSTIKQHALEHRDALRERFRQRFGKAFDPVHFTGNVDRVFDRGKQLAEQQARR